MRKTIMTATDLRKHLNEVLNDATTGAGYTVITYHGLGVAAIVPLDGSYGLAFTKAMREVEDAPDHE